MRNKLDNDLDLNSPDYTPVKLINETAFKLGAKTDHQLCIKLSMDSGQMSRLRHRQEMLTHRMIIQILDRVPDWTIGHVRALAGVPFKG